ncbi:MAG: hypothetical protein JNM12_10135 [Alphaproteobacteria bacterium]|nr:hypothetical protein [Alphaproteobacteria bacterium]
MGFTFILKYWRLLLVAMLVAVIGYYRFLAHYRLVQLDEARRATVQAQASLRAQTGASAATAAAIQRTMEEADERNQFELGAAQEIAVGRKAGDGGLAPVLRDTAGRLRVRQAGRTALHGGGSGKPHAMPQAKNLP